MAGHGFADSQGGRWEVDVGPAQAARVRQATGVDLPALVAGDMQALSALLDDSAGRRWALVLGVLCAEQARKAGLTAGEFAALLSDPQTAEYACGALCQALWDAYCPGEGYTVRQTSRFDRAMARIVDRSTRAGFDTAKGLPGGKA